MGETDHPKPEFKLWVYRLAQFALFILYKVCFRYRSFGSENFPADAMHGVILAPNHASYLDPPSLGISLKEPIAYLAKDYLFKPFILGRLLRWLGCIPIKSEAEDFRSIRRLIRCLKEGKTVLVFPEGTRSLTGEFQEPEPGVGFLAVTSRAYVLPVYIQGTYAAFPKGAKRFRCRPVSVYFGKPFVPALDEALMAEQNPYRAVALRIMEKIEEIKETVQRKT